MSLADQQWCPTSVQVTVLQARGLRIKGKSGTNDAYAVIQVGKDKYQTSVVEKCVAPVWKEEASFDLPQLQQGGGGGSTLHVHVLHRALVGPDKLLGQAVINLLQLSEDKTRNKTEWFKLLDKTGKPDKDRGEVLVDIQFMRNNMTASMFDLSAAGKSRSRLGKFKDKVRGKKKESDSVTSVVPSFTQVLTDSEEEANGDGEAAAAGKDGKRKKHKIKSLFSPKSNLQKSMSQSMSVLPGKNSTLSSSQSSGLNVESSEGKKKFKFMIHKRSGSSDSKDSSSGHEKQAPVEQSNLCINGSHIYCEEPPPRTSRISSNFSLSSSGHGSMEDVPENSPPSESQKAMGQYSPWEEEEEEEEEEETSEVENRKESVNESRRTLMEEERKEEEKIRRQQKKLESLAEDSERQEEEETRKAEEEEVKRVQEEKIRREEEKKRREEEERVRMKEEHERLAEEKRLQELERRKLEEERVRIEKEKRRLEEEERAKMEERRREEEQKLAEEKRLEEAKRAQEEKRRQEKEAKMAEEKRLQELERRKLEEERIRIEEEEKKRLEEEERAKMEERRRREEEQKLAEEKRLKELERRKLEEERIRIEEEKKRLEEEEGVKMEEKRRREEQKLAEEKRLEEEKRAQEEKRRQEEEAKMAEEKRLQELKRMKLEEERIRIEEEKKRLEEEERAKMEARRRREEEQKLAEEKRRLEEEERVRKEKEERRKEEERRQKEEEFLRKQKEEREKKRIQLEQERSQREEEERIRKEEEKKIREEEQERARKEKEEYERLEEEKMRQEEQRRIEEEEKVKKEKEERVRMEEEIVRRKEEKERARKEKEEMERLEEQRLLKEQEMRRIEEEQKVRREEEERIRREKKEVEAKKLEKSTRNAEEPERKENKTKDEGRAAGEKSKVSSSAEVTSTNPFDENFSCNPFEEIPDSPHGSAAKVATVQQRCQSAVSSVGSKTVSLDEKDLISTQREKRPAPQPPGRSQAEKETHREQDVSARHLAQITKQSKDKDVKTVSVPPQRSVQMIAPLSRSPTDSKNSQSLMQSNNANGTTSAAKHSKRPAPSIPHPAEEKQSSEQKTSSNLGGAETKQVKVYGLNPFEDEDDEDESELTGQDDTTVSGGAGSVRWPAAGSQTGDKDAASQPKIKSLKMAHAPPPPAKDDITSSTLMNPNTEGSHAAEDRSAAAPDNSAPQACDPHSDATSPVHVQESLLQESQSLKLQSIAEAGVKKDGAPTPSRRLQPVRPLNPLEQQGASVVQGENQNKSTGILSGVQDKTKVSDSGMKGPYSQLTREELISLVLKQEKQLSERDHKISELEQYIDNLLVRVIEEKPSILMSIGTMKKAA
ncbi:trichohyalin [Archocentrus centrarchus]|uniref:trichohyalin n=1 Tax=Archocentrus centrarchus TaxID=63155 RepID=UPI0011E9BFFC|nr:trichohyalin-like [Archocentrus centrarchus]